MGWRVNVKRAAKRNPAATSSVGRSLVSVVSHPLIQHNLTQLRDRRTGHETFRRVLSQTAALMVYEVTRNFPLKQVAVTEGLSRQKVADALGITLHNLIAVSGWARSGCE